MKYRFPCAAVLLLASGCAPSNEQSARTPPRFTAAMNHPYFPLTANKLSVYEGEHDGQRIYEEVRTRFESRTIQGVPCSTLLQDVYVDSELTEMTSEWYAQDLDGNVWRFGEENLVRDGQDFVVGPNSWVAGEAGFDAWIAFAAVIREGDRYTGHQPSGTEVFEVTSVNAKVTVAGGSFANCVEILENPEGTDQDIILYAPGVGRVLETSSHGKLELVSERKQ